MTLRERYKFTLIMHRESLLRGAFRLSARIEVEEEELEADLAEGEESEEGDESDDASDSETDDKSQE